MLVYGFPQPGPHNMRVNLRRRNVGVPQHGLHASQVCPALQQVRRESVPQHMRRKIAEHSSLFPMGGQKLPEGLASHGAAAIGHEEIRTRPVLQQPR